MVGCLAYTLITLNRKVNEMNTKTVKLTLAQMQFMFRIKKDTDGILFFTPENENSMFFVCNNLKNVFTASEFRNILNAFFYTDFGSIIDGRQVNNDLFEIVLSN